MNVTAFPVPCENPRACPNGYIFDLGALSLPQIDTTTLTGNQLLHWRLGNVACEKCYTTFQEALQGNVKATGELRAEKQDLEAEVEILRDALHDMQEKMDSEDRGVQATLAVAAEENIGAAKSTIRPLGVMARTRTLCASGTCSNQAVVTL